MLGARRAGRIGSPAPSNAAVTAVLQLMETPEDQLIRAVLAGDDDAFGDLVARYEGRVHRLLGRFTRDPQEVEDLAQEVFVKVFRKLHTFQQDSGLFTWIYRVAVNTANDHFSRRGRRRLRLVEDDEQLDDGGVELGDGAPDAPLMDAELRRITREIVDGLPEKYRNILILREYEDLSYTDMAAVLECSIGTVESRLFRARQRFKAALEDRYPELVPGSRHEGRVRGRDVAGGGAEGGIR